MYVKDIEYYNCSYCKKGADWTNSSYPKRKGIFFKKDTYWLTPIGTTVFYCNNCYEERS